VCSFDSENGKVRARRVRDGDNPVLHTGNTISQKELRNAVRVGEGNAAATMAAVTGASGKGGGRTG